VCRDEFIGTLREILEQLEGADEETHSAA